MAKIIVSLDGKIVDDITLSKERMTIGRRPHNDVVIENLAVSGEHAVIVTNGNDSVLEDLNSTNGTLINGQPVKKHVLQHNDVIELAKYRIKFLVGPAQITANDDDAVTAKQHAAVTPPARQTPAKNSRADKPSTATVNTPQPETRQGTLKVMNGANTGKELALNKALTTLGRPGVQVAVIARRREGYFLTHVEGAEYPAINGKAIGAEPRQLKHGDLIDLSATKMAFSLK